MSNFIKKSIFIAVIGAAGFAMQAHNGLLTPATAVGDANTVAAIEHVIASGDAVATITSERFGPEIAPTIYDDYVYSGSGDAAAETGLALPGARNAQTAETDKVAERRRKARAKMSGPVAALAMTGGQQPADLIVSYDTHPELFEDGRIESLGGEIIRHYEVLKLLAVRLPADALIELAIEDSVERVSLDGVVAATSVSSRVAANEPGYGSGNSSYKGSYVGVAVLDSGVANHWDLSEGIKQYSFLDGNYPAPAIGDNQIEKYNETGRVDEYGHGTHIAGIVAGSGKLSSGSYSGPASRSRIISLQVLNQDGHGSMSDVMAALDWLLRYGDYFNIRVANLSLGMPVTESNTTDPLVLAVEQVWDSGIFVAVAAGNYGREGYFSTTSPGNSRKVITVGSLTDNGTGADYSDDYVSSYSSRGPTPGDHVSKPDLVAPGNRLVAATPQKSSLANLIPGLVVPCTAQDQCTYNYMTLSGTSMATGMVSAAAALMLQKDPTLSPSTVKARLMRSARKIGESPVDAGAGLLDIDAALNENGTVKGQALSPLLVYDKETGGTLIQDTSQLWGDDLWGAGYLWTDGENVKANGYLWTDGGVSANGYLWTDGGIWANGYLWTDGGVAAFGYLWTDGGVNANGYLWTDGGVNANGYLWTDGGGLRGLSLFDLNSDTPRLNDDD